MPPGKLSRHLYTLGIRPNDADLILPALGTPWPGRSGILHLTPREPYRYRDFSDNRVHIVLQGDSLWNLAARYYSEFNRPSDLWWVIADFQPIPIIDPTIDLDPGSSIVIPSSRTVREEIFNEDRRDESILV